MLWSFSVQPLSWLSYKIHFSSHIIIWWRNGSLLLHRLREDYTLTWFFWFSVSSWGTHLLSFFTSPICFKCRMTVERWILGSLATSHVVVRALMIALNWLLSTSNGQPLRSSSSRLCLLIFKALSPSQNFLNHYCTVCVLAVPGPNALLMLRVVSAALWPILNSNKKIAWIHFLSSNNFHSLKYIQNWQVIIH